MITGSDAILFVKTTCRVKVTGKLFKNLQGPLVYVLVTMGYWEAEA